MSNPLDLNGRTAIVTGGTKGLGRVIATTLLEHGAEVIVCARNAPETPVMPPKTRRSLRAALPEEQEEEIALARRMSPLALDGASSAERPSSESRAERTPGKDLGADLVEVTVDPYDFDAFAEEVERKETTFDVPVATSPVGGETNEDATPPIGLGSPASSAVPETPETSAPAVVEAESARSPTPSPSAGPATASSRRWTGARTARRRRLKTAARPRRTTAPCGSSPRTGSPATSRATRPCLCMCWMDRSYLVLHMTSLCQQTTLVSASSSTICSERARAASSRPGASGPRTGPASRGMGARWSFRRLRMSEKSRKVGSSGAAATNCLRLLLE